MIKLFCRGTRVSYENFQNSSKRYCSSSTLSSSHQHKIVIRTLYKAILKAAIVLEAKPTLKVFISLNSETQQKLKYADARPTSFLPPNETNILDSKMNLFKATRHYFRMNSTYFRKFDSPETLIAMDTGFEILRMLRNSVEIGQKCGFIPSDIPYFQMKLLPKSKPRDHSEFYEFLSDAIQKTEEFPAQPIILDYSRLKKIWRAAELILSKNEKNSHFIQFASFNENVLPSNIEIKPEMGVYSYLETIESTLNSLHEKLNILYNPIISNSSQGQITPQLDEFKQISEFIISSIKRVTSENKPNKSIILEEEEEEEEFGLYTKSHHKMTKEMYLDFAEILQKGFSAFHHLKKGFDAMENRKFQISLEEFVKSINLTPIPEALVFRAWVKFHRIPKDLNSEETRQIIETCIEDCFVSLIIDPNYGNSFNDIGLYFKFLGYKVQSESFFELASESTRCTFPALPQVNLTVTKKENGDFLTALRFALTALDFDPDDHAIRDQCLSLRKMLSKN